jgi:type IV secretory pathway TraG/TraD family ATPase VirD4
MVALLAVMAASCCAIFGWRRLCGLQAGSPLGKSRLARRALARGWVRQRTWATPSNLRRLWVQAPVSGRPYLGYARGLGARMLAAEREVQPMVVAPPRSGKSSGYVIPWLLEHDGPALVLSTKRDVYEATVAHRRRLGRMWVYDPLGGESSGFTPLVPAGSWSGAIRVGEAMASAAQPQQGGSVANEFWDREAASLLAPILHAAAICGAGMGEVISWLDARDFGAASEILRGAGAARAAVQLEGVGRRDERNRETTVMSALSLLRVYRHPQVCAAARDEITPAGLLDGRANTIYVVAAGHDQEALRPVILALMSAVYQQAIGLARRYGPLRPALWMLLDEAANIAPVRDLGAWLSQCGDHGVTIATIWQSIAQIDQRYGRAARDAICAASTAQVFIPPIAEPATSEYLSGLLGEETVASGSGGWGSRQTLSAAERKAGPGPWLRQIPRGQAILIYRDLPPAVVRAPGWFERCRLSRASRR